MGAGLAIIAIVAFQEFGESAAVVICVGGVTVYGAICWLLIRQFNDLIGYRRVGFFAQRKREKRRRHSHIE